MGPRPLGNFALATAVLGGGIAWACRSAASVVLDLPPPAAAAPAPESRPRAAAPAGDGVPPPPAIEQVHDADSVLALLPQDSGGRVDWVAAVRRGVVRPRPSLPRGAAVSAPGASGFDFFFQADDPEFDTSFPHSSHGLWISCRGCHPTVYRYRGTRTDMEGIDAGESCGVCHLTVAFTPDACYRCHPGVAARRKVAPELGEDLVLAREEGARDDRYPPARFSHWRHRIRYQCTACHPDEFPMRAGTTKVTMDQMKSGMACGACHDSRSAFGLAECDRCHVHGAAPERTPGGPAG